MSAHEKFTFANLPKMFGGQLPLLFDIEAKRALADCKDRFEDDKVRVVKIEMRFNPVANTHGDEVTTEVEVITSLPKQRTRLHTLAVRNNGEATFHPDLPGEPEGSTLYDDGEGK